MVGYAKANPQANQAKLDLTASELALRLRGWAQTDEPLYRGLAGAIGVAIERGDLPPGMRLPSKRALAPAISVPHKECRGRTLPPST
jgi:hypothetical protein